MIKFARVPEILASAFKERVPEQAVPIIAWQYNNQIIVEIADIPEEDAHLHSCDWEGCGSLSHVVRFTVEDKYQQEEA